MASILEVITARLKRADDHFEALRAEQSALLDNDFCRTDLQIDRYKRAGLRRIASRVITIGEFPPSYAIAVGDVAHSLRAALDNLAFAVIKPPSGKEKAVYFPICESSAKFRAVAPSMLPGASRAIRAAFERLQPYHRRKMPEAQYLLHLNALNNWDKHRAITVCALNGVITGVGAEVDANFEIVRHKFYPFRRLKADAILAAFWARARPGTPKGYQGNVEMNPNLMIVVAFDKGMTRPLPGANVQWVLYACREYIERRVIPELRRFL